MSSPDITIHADQAARSVSRHGVSLREDTVYTNHKGREKRGIRKRTDKALSKLAEVLPKVLEPEETILYVAQVQAPASVFEQLAFGWYIYYVTRTVLVFTNRRLLHFQVKRDGSWKRSLRSVRWGDVERAKIKGWLFSPTLWLKYRTGKKETYWALRRDDARKIKLLLEALLPNSSGELSPAQQMVSLCPDSLTPLTPGTYQCPECGLTFKDERTMIRLSLLYPGGGYFYAGHWFLGLGDALVEAILLGAVISSLVIGLGFAQQQLEPLEPARTMGDHLTGAGIIALLLILEKLFTIHHGRRFVREFIPLRDSAGPSRWAAFGLVSYLGVALLVWGSISFEGPPAQVAPDLTVSKAYFGLFNQNLYGNLEFTPTAAVPHTVGQQYGWVLRVDTSRKTLQWREEITLPAKPGAAPASSTGKTPQGEENSMVAVNKGESIPEGGIIGSYWVVGEDDPLGTYSLRVYLDDVLVHTFTFQMQ